MSDKIASCVDKILSSCRLLEYSNILSLFDEIVELLNGNSLDQKYVDRITQIIFPIFYPGDNSPSRLRFQIQCISCSYLIKISPDTRYDILVSILDIFQQYPHIFMGKTAIKSTLSDFLEYTPNYWDLINEAIKELSYDMTWCFFLFCINNIPCSRRLPNWDLVLRLLSDTNLYKSRKIKEIISFLKRSVDEWGCNPSIAAALADQCLYLIMTDDIPSFLYDSNSYAITVEEQTIEAISKHCSIVGPSTAKALAQISRNDGHFQSPLFQISLFLALLKNVPPNFRKTLAHRIQKMIENIVLSEKVCAHIVAAASLCNVRGFSMIDNFSDAFKGNEQKHSLFFAYLADCAECLDISATVPLLTDALNSIAISGTSFGVCKFVSSLLNKCRMHPEILSNDDIQNISQYIDVVTTLTNKKIENAANKIENISNMINLTSKIIAKLSIICHNQINTSKFPLNAPYLSQTMFSCAIYAYSLTMAAQLPAPLENICCAYIISEFYGFEEYSNFISAHVRRLTNSPDFPPEGYIISDNATLNIYDVSQKAFKSKTCSNNKFYSVIISFIPHFQSPSLVKDFVKHFWNEKLASEIPLDSIPKLLSCCDDYNLFLKLFIVLININPTGLHQQISDYLSKPIFRYWFISKVLAISAFYLPNSYKLARKLLLTQTEFKLFIPALKKVLQPSPSPTAVRAAAIKFIGKNLNAEPLLTKFCIATSINLLLQKKNKIIEFPNIDSHYEGDNFEEILNEFQLAVDNRNAASLELEASLFILNRSVECDDALISDHDLDRIHHSLKRHQDPRIRKPYLHFLGSLGLRGLPYATQISQNVSIPPFF
ncbi:hypothetical protein TRFO_33949 [Tritrichomonas foetus]|uniref:Uncharacterized protein n=1 Tax=Tritrichomonas foetus TaxID=1144522 RepID=A0A1J4JKB2_9EUKA|nr:hypothetical protein TRFO_33949 [Tritrichomonas foetus]|eukprot:OHS99578.1 hypothetical protein TRFO_33949 [Tritrichomonas foetus]